jgi:ribosomal-protein-alanine N-acetyltransferase
MGNLIPPVLRHKDLELTPIRLRDRKQYSNIREVNRDWLQPWDATLPKLKSTPDSSLSSDIDPASNAAFYSLYFAARRSNKDGTGLTLGMRTRGRLIGLITAANLTYGAARNCQIGYWIDRRFAGQSFTPRAVALVIDYLLLDRQFHRAEIAIRPENSASLRVVAKLGMRSEGLRPRYLHIDGAWRDHHIFAVDSSEIGVGLISNFN